MRFGILNGENEGVWHWDEKMKNDMISTNIEGEEEEEEEGGSGRGRWQKMIPTNPTRRRVGTTVTTYLRPTAPPHHHHHRCPSSSPLLYFLTFQFPRWGRQTSRPSTPRNILPPKDADFPGLPPPPRLHDTCCGHGPVLFCGGWETHIISLCFSVCPLSANPSSPSLLQR